MQLTHPDMEYFPTGGTILCQRFKEGRLEHSSYRWDDCGSWTATQRNVTEQRLCYRILWFRGYAISNTLHVLPLIKQFKAIGREQLPFHQPPWSRGREFCKVNSNNSFLPSCAKCFSGGQRKEVLLENYWRTSGYFRHNWIWPWNTLFVVYWWVMALRFQGLLPRISRIHGGDNTWRNEIRRRAYLNGSHAIN